MVRIIPSRLKPGTPKSPLSRTTSRNNSPMRNKGDSASPEGRKDSGLVLNVVILKARNLAAKDRGGTSDPYLVLTLGDAKHITHSVSKSLNPEWNEQCHLPVSGPDGLLLDVCCWDKDRFGKDYLGEFDLALEEIFANNSTEQAPKWIPLKSKRPGKKTSVVSGEVLLQFTVYDATNKEATPSQVLEKLAGIARTVVPDTLTRTPTATSAPAIAPSKGSGNSPSPPPLSRQPTDIEEEEEEEAYDDETPEDEDPTKPEAIEKKKRRLRIKGLKRKKRDNPYEFTNGGVDVVGIIFLEICKITDLPPESNLTKTSFDMDPFVVASLGKKTYRTKTIRHKLNPVYNEKMVFQVLAHEQKYSFAFTVIDHDKYSGNDFIASVDLPLKELIDKSPRADPENGLYDLPETPEYVAASGSKSKFKRLGMSRSSSAQSLGKLMRPGLGSKNPSQATTVTQGTVTPGTVPSSFTLQQVESPETIPQLPSPGLLAPGDNAVAAAPQTAGESLTPETEDPSFTLFTLPLKMKNTEKWESKHNPQLYVRAKYMPYPALRQQFWRAMLKQYDSDESGRISKVELTTMLDTLGSTLRESTIDSFFQRFPHRVEDDTWDMSMDEAVICLEDQLQAKVAKPSMAAQMGQMGEKVRAMMPDADKMKAMFTPGQGPAKGPEPPTTPAPSQPSETSPDSVGNSTMVVPENSLPGEEGEALAQPDDLNASSGEEHVVEIRECPICHQPRLNKRKDADIITHIATCASQDWRQVNNIVMGGFVTASQAQRKWYSKVITKVTYGGYKLGANSANILVQDRLTGQINEEKMSVYVRLGIRLLYKGLKSNNMENKRIRKLLKGLSIKQGKKYDDPASRSEIQKFIEFHRLDMSEVLKPVEEFKNFNEFFYRALKPEARPASAPDNPHIIVSPADCRSVVFNRVDVAQQVWVKGREFSVKRLLGDAYPEDVKRFENGALGIFRLAPQDYHRFHIPVDGVMGKPKPIAGEYYTVNPMAIRSALDVYGENVRVVVPIDSAVHGRVMVICVGAMMVGSTVITRQEGEHVKKAEELGYFKFGGSTIVLLFEEGKMQFDDDLVENSKMALETLIRVGMSIGHSPMQPQHTPDMRKDASEVTEEDKKDAKRRIQGSGFNEDNSSPNDSGGDDGVTPLSPPALT